MRLLSFLFTLLFLTVGSSTQAETKPHAFQVNERLGRGINIAGIFETQSETIGNHSWNNKYLDVAAEEGFKHVRLPIRWDTDGRTLNVAPYTIDEVFMNRIADIVDYAIQKDLYIVINMHNHDALMQNPMANRACFLAQWEQIATRFKDYPENLVFEILNEPIKEMKLETWNEFSKAALAKIRETNADRVVMIGSARANSIEGLYDLTIPEDDENIIVTVHYYNPFGFTHQGATWVDPKPATGIKWYNTELEQKIVATDFDQVKEFQARYNVPIHVGEFGVYKEASEESRYRWTAFIATFIEDQGYSSAYFELCNLNFGFYNISHNLPGGKEYDEELMAAVKATSKPRPGVLASERVYDSKFGTSESDWGNWRVLYNNEGLATQDKDVKDKIVVNIANGGAHDSNVQLVRQKMTLAKSSHYRCNFTLSTDVPYRFDVGLGMTDAPWQSYFYNKVLGGFEKDFTISNVTGTTVKDGDGSKIVINIGGLGAGARRVVLSNFSIDLITSMDEPLPPVGVEENGVEGEDVNFYPNPVQDILHIDNKGAYRSCSIYTLSGIRIAEYALTEGLNVIRSQDWSSGIYFVRLNSERENKTVKVVRY